MYRSLQPQQPFFRLQPAITAIAVEFAVFADQAVTWHNNRHWVHGVGGADCAVSIGMPDLYGDICICSSFPVRDAANGLQGFALEWGKDIPVNVKIKGAAFTFDKLVELRGIWLDPVPVFLLWLEEAPEVGILLGLRFKPLDGEQTQVAGGDAEISKGRIGQNAKINRRKRGFHAVIIPFFVNKPAKYRIVVG